MRITVSDYLIRALSKNVDGVALAATAIHAVEDPAARYDLVNGNVRFDGHGVTVIGKPDSTGKFFRISAIRLDTTPKD